MRLLWALVLPLTLMWPWVTVSPDPLALIFWSFPWIVSWWWGIEEMRYSHKQAALRDSLMSIRGKILAFFLTLSRDWKCGWNQALGHWLRYVPWDPWKKHAGSAETRPCIWVGLGKLLLTAHTGHVEYCVGGGTEDTSHRQRLEDLKCLFPVFLMSLTGILFSYLKVSILYNSYLSHCVSKMLRRSNSRQEGFILAYRFRSVVHQGMAAGTQGSWSHCTWWALMLSSLSSLDSVTNSIHMSSPSILRVGLQLPQSRHSFSDMLSDSSSRR